MAGETRRRGGRPTREAEAAIGLRLVEAAVGVLQRRGLAASMDEIAAAAGISKQAIYRRYDGKVDLIRDVVGSGLSRMLEQERAALGTDGDPLERLRRWTRLAFANMASPEWLGAIALFQGELRDQPELRDDIARWEAQAIAVPRALIDELAAAGRLTRMSAEDAAAVLVDLVSAAQARAARALAAGTLSPAWAERCFAPRWQAFALIVGPLAA